MLELGLMFVFCFSGQIDTILSEEGVKQSELAGGRLKDEQFTHAFSSDLNRAYTVRSDIAFSLDNSFGLPLYWLY